MILEYDAVNDFMVKDKIEIKNIIYEVRGKQVMLDSDLAILYQCKNGTKEINQAVQRNKEKFPNRFCFQLTQKEIECLWSQNVTTNISSKRRSNPTVFTEQGIAMLATILKSKIATQVSIDIMDAFILMRKYITKNLIDCNQMLINHENRINLLEETLSNFKEKNNHIFFEGQIYDSYSLMKRIFDRSKESIIIIDNYVDKSLLDIVSKTKNKIIIITNIYKKCIININLIKFA